MRGVTRILDILTECIEALNRDVKNSDAARGIETRLAAARRIIKDMEEEKNGNNNHSNHRDNRNIPGDPGRRIRSPRAQGSKAALDKV